MSVYTELLRMALAQDQSSEEPIGDLVTRTVTARPRTGNYGPSADRIAEWLAYDTALVRLCERLRIDHGMLDGDAGPASRARAESLLVARMPSLGGGLA